MGELIIVNQEVNKGTLELLNLLAQNVNQYGDSFATIFSQQKAANILGTSVRTVYRQIEGLVSQGIVEMETRRGRNGGTVVVYNNEEIRFKSHKDNPITGTTRTAKELRDRYYPNKGTYRPDDRTPEEKERDRIRAKRVNDINSKMNNDIRYKGFPDREFFEMAENPKNVFKSYMLSRAYNAVLISRIENWKNEAERDGNVQSFNMASKALKRYQNYDVLTHEFMGTQTFESFERLREVIDVNKFDMLGYMNNAFDTFIYLLKMGRRAKPPYVNTLPSNKSIEKYKEQINWKKNFEREHPYYATLGDVNMVGRYFPITQIINRAYYNPMEESMDMQTIIDGRLSNIDNTPTSRAEKAYYEQVVEAIKDTDYSEEAKQQAINFFNEKISVQLIPNMPEADYIIANLRKILHGDDMESEHEQYSREWYAERGDIHHSDAKTPLTNKMKVKRGYLIDFSINAGQTFENVWRVIENSSSYFWSINEIKDLLADLGDLIPLTELGDVDLEQVISGMVSEEQNEAQKKLDAVFANIKSKDDEEYLEETLDNAPKMWYDVLEAEIGNSLRDGKSMTEETTRR